MRRDDLLTKAGFSKAPTTWEELAQQAAAVNKPPLFGLGLALSNVGDGNVQIGVLQSYGGRIADDTGTKAAIKSDATREYLRWLKAAWDKKLFPPGVTTWDGAGDNQAYLAGQAAFIANTGSVGIAAKTQDPELYKATQYSSLPGGPKGVISADRRRTCAPFRRSSKNPDAARALIEYLAQPEFMNSVLRAGDLWAGAAEAGGVQGILDAIRSFRALLDLVKKARRPPIPTSTTRPSRTPTTTSSCRRWLSVSSSTVGISTARWTRRRRRSRRIYDKYK